jgi:hypothetical protein
MIDVDDKIKELSEKGLKIVPTIIVKGFNEPIQGKNVFNWLEGILAMKNNKQVASSNDIYLPEVGITQQIGATIPLSNPNNNVIKRTMVPPIILPKQDVKNNVEIKNNTTEIKLVNGVEIKTAPSVKSQPFGFIQEELTGFSDPFAYLKTDNPLPKSFLPYDKDLEIYTAPEGDKLNKKRQEMLMKSIELVRDNDKTIFVKQMETDHQKILSNDNKKR